MSKLQEWEFCTNPKAGDIIKWEEPLWAKPNKPRGKRDKVGDQDVTAKVISIGDIIELEVVAAEKTSGSSEISIKAGDKIKRKKSSLEKGDCHKRVK